MAHLADLTDFEARSNFAGFTTICAGILMPLFCVLASVLHPRPQLAFPISRRKQAEVVFWLGLTQLASAFFLQVTSLLSVTLLGQVVSGDYLPDFGVLPTLTLSLPILLAGPFMLAAIELRNALLRVFSAIAAGIGLVAIALTRTVWLPSMGSVTGVLTLVALTTLGVSLYWVIVQWRYRHADLLPVGVNGEVPILQVAR